MATRVEKMMRPKERRYHKLVGGLGRGGLIFGLLSSLLLFKTTEEEFGRECDRDSIIIS
jgi:hypothetical protein